MQSKPRILSAQMKICVNKFVFLLNVLLRYSV